MVLTSATLATARGGEHGFDYIRTRLGLDDADEVLLTSPFDFRKQAKLHVETQLGDPNNLQQFVPPASKAIAHYVQKTQGRCFVLLTSYAMLEAVAEELEEFCGENDYKLLIQGRNLPRGVMLDRFRKNPRTILLGTASFWQGVDVAGEALQNVIIAKLPFAAPNDPIIEARIDARLHEGYQVWAAYNWNLVAPHLAETHRVVAPDLSGFGYTDPIDDDSTVERNAQLVADVIDYYGREVPPRPQVGAAIGQKDEVGVR